MTILTPENARTALVNGKRVYLLKVAKAQKVLIYLVLAMLICNFFGMAAIGWVGRGLNMNPGYIAVTMLLVQFTIAIIAVIQTVRLAVASGSNPIIAVLAGIFMLVPIIGLVLIVLANGRATAILQRHGVNVAFMGVSASEMTKLVIGACPSCGYDIRGLPSPQCPECGAVLPQS